MIADPVAQGCAVGGVVREPDRAGSEDPVNAGGRRDSASCAGASATCRDHGGAGGHGAVDVPAVVHVAGEEHRVTSGGEAAHEFDLCAYGDPPPFVLPRKRPGVRGVVDV